MAYNITKLRSSSTIKKIVFFTTIVISIIIINGLVRSIYDLWNKQDVVERARVDLEKQRQENKELQAQLSYVKSDEFIEKEARDKLFMVKEGESKVLIPDSLIEKEEPEEVIVVPNWKKWLDLFIEGY